MTEVRHYVILKHEFLHIAKIFNSFGNDKPSMRQKIYPIRLIFDFHHRHWVQILNPCRPVAIHHTWQWN